MSLPCAKCDGTGTRHWAACRHGAWCDCGYTKPRLCEPCHGSGKVWCLACGERPAVCVVDGTAACDVCSEASVQEAPTQEAVLPVQAHLPTEAEWARARATTTAEMLRAARLGVLEARFNLLARQVVEVNEAWAQYLESDRALQAQREVAQ